MGLREWLGRSPRKPVPEPENRDALSFQQWVDYFKFAGNVYPMYGSSGMTGTSVTIGNGFAAYVDGMLKSNGVVFACMALRLRVFSDIRFQFREINNGRPGKLFGGIDGRNPASTGLRLLNRPWPGAATGDLLARMVMDVDLAGNAFVLRQSSRLTRLRPDWVTIILGSRREGASAWDLDAELLGYQYTEGGPSSGNQPVTLLPEQVCHWAPLPDPTSPARGMSWLTPIIREVSSDSAATQHKMAFFENGATVNFVMEFPTGTTQAMYDVAVDSFKEEHEGAWNAYKTLFLLGATAKTIGADFQQMDFKAVQGAGETRIASAAGVHPVLVALSEGLQGSSLNAGNFASARRATADMTFRPLWRNLCGSLSQIIDSPENAELWYDDRDCMFLQEDRKDAAEIQKIKADTIKALAEAGYDPESVVDAVMSEDMDLLEHSGMFSVQLQKPGAKEPAAPPGTPQPPPTNGNAPVGSLQPTGGSEG
jgi:phage portal protein BeeE